MEAARAYLGSAWRRALGLACDPYLTVGLVVLALALFEMGGEPWRDPAGRKRPDPTSRAGLMLRAAAAHSTEE